MNFVSTHTTADSTIRPALSGAEACFAPDPAGYLSRHLRQSERTKPSFSSVGHYGEISRTTNANGGAMTKGIMDENSPSVENSLLDRLGAQGRRVFSGIHSSVIDLSLQGYAKSGKFPYYGGSQPNKAGTLGLKWFLNQFTF